MVINLLMKSRLYRAVITATAKPKAKQQCSRYGQKVKLLETGTFMGYTFHY